MSPISSLALVTNRSSIASPLRQLFTLYPFLDVEGNASTPPSSPVPSEQPVATDSRSPVMGFVPPSFNNEGTMLCVSTTGEQPEWVQTGHRHLHIKIKAVN
ncbi:hypothetical protein QYF61_015282 [Mycteria americana]|uniref:Uncharacterized protein n=1 Tax=Mycteria americana TaxID=33587 RepID=A0AAN7NVB3_MYCAM|nr:hypothetical protein QYF61_015282 [Mycteria americana]